MSLSGSDTGVVSLRGPVGGIRRALESLEYLSPSGYFGTDDKMHGLLVSGSLKRKATTNLDVSVNCGGQKCGTGTLFSLGKFDQNGNFRRTKYITSVSMCGTELPSTFYGYCGTKFRFDRDDGQMTRYPTDEGDQRWNYCSNPALHSR